MGTQVFDRYCLTGLHFVIPWLPIPVSCWTKALCCIVHIRHQALFGLTSSGNSFLNILFIVLMLYYINNSNIYICTRYHIENKFVSLHSKSTLSPCDYYVFFLSWFTHKICTVSESIVAALSEAVTASAINLGILSEADWKQVCWKTSSRLPSTMTTDTSNFGWLLRNYTKWKRLWAPLFSCHWLPEVPHTVVLCCFGLSASRFDCCAQRCPSAYLGWITVVIVAMLSVYFCLN